MAEDKFTTIRIETEVKTLLDILSEEDRRSNPLEFRWLIEREIDRRNNNGHNPNQSQEVTNGNNN